MEITFKKPFRGVAQVVHDVYSRTVLGAYGKQADASISALDGGYYAVPRETTVGKIARARKASRTRIVSEMIEGNFDPDLPAQMDSH
jgi:hypothetical protein